jgi:hypothetical protein
VSVYLTAADVPCAYEVVGRVAGTVMAASLNDYVVARDAFLGRAGAELGADGVLIPEDRPEPGRGRVGLSVQRIGGVSQPMQRPVDGLAVGFVADECEVDPLETVTFFEGIIRYRGRGMLPSTTTYVSGTRFRQETATSDGTSVVIVDEIERRGVVLAPSSAGAATPATVPELAPGQIRVTDLDEVDVIAGIECRMLRLDLGRAFVTVCAASGLGVTTGGILAPVYGLDQLAQAFPNGFLPLRMVGQVFGGGAEVTAESVRPGPVDQTLFQPLEVR